MRQLTAGKIVKYGLIGFVALVFIFPIYWMIVDVYKRQEQTCVDLAPYIKFASYTLRTVFLYN